MTKRIPRGIRNNNPGNIEANSGFLGETGSDGRFTKFDTMSNGIRAMLVVIRTYITKRGVKTVSDIIHRWAPPVENKTDKYVEFVCRYSGLKADFEVDHLNKSDMLSLIKAMIYMECSKKAADEYIFDVDYETAWKRYIKSEPRASLKGSRTVKAATVGAGAVLGTTILEGNQDLVLTVMDNLPVAVDAVSAIPYAKYLLLGVGLVAFGAVLYSRYDDWKNKRR